MTGSATASSGTRSTTTTGCARCSPSSADDLHNLRRDPAARLRILKERYERTAAAIEDARRALGDEGACDTS